MKILFLSDLFTYYKESLSDELLKLGVKNFELNKIWNYDSYNVYPTIAYYAGRPFDRIVAFYLQRFVV